MIGFLFQNRLDPTLQALIDPVEQRYGGALNIRGTLEGLVDLTRCELLSASDHYLNVSDLGALVVYEPAPLSALLALIEDWMRQLETPPGP